MIYIVYTTQTTKKQYKFDLNGGWFHFLTQIRRSSIARDVIGYDENSVTWDKLINAGLDIEFEGESSFEKALIKILPYNKPLYNIVRIYRYLNSLNGKIRKAVEIKLCGEKYNNIYELYDDIRGMCKKSAKNAVSLYTPMTGTLDSYSYYNRDPVPEEIIYKNIDLIESSIQNAFIFDVVQCDNIGYEATKNIVAAEFHADLAKTHPLVRLDIYFNRTFTQQEVEQFKKKHFNHMHFNSVNVQLPEYEFNVIIDACDPVFTTEEMIQKYFNK
jgi:hypothetical protein